MSFFCPILDDLMKYFDGAVFRGFCLQMKPMGCDGDPRGGATRVCGGGGGRCATVSGLMNWSCFGMMSMMICFCGVAFCWTAGVGHGGGCLETTGRKNLRRSCGGCDLSVSESWRSGWGVGGLIGLWDALGEVWFPGGTGPWRV